VLVIIINEQRQAHLAVKAKVQMPKVRVAPSGHIVTYGRRVCWFGLGWIGLGLFWLNMVGWSMS